MSDGRSLEDRAHAELAATQQHRTPNGAITVAAGGIPAMTRAAVAALKAADTPIYDRGGLLVRPVRAASPSHTDGVRRGADAIMLRPVDAEWLRLRLAEAAEWQRWDARRRAYVPTDPPMSVVRPITINSDEGGWPYLRTVVRHPVLTPAGRLIGTDGYDPDTQLLVVLSGQNISLPDPLDRASAQAAVERLRHLLRYYPWVGPADEAVALSMLLTALARPVLPAAPMHAVDAPAAGSGKSLLVDVAAILATGERAVVMEWGRDPVEAGKRLDGMLLAGDPVIAIDNIEAALGGAALCQTLTQPTRRIRPLGGSAVTTTPCTALMTATGNNLIIPGDMVRRSVVCRLDAGTDAPERRTIPQDLIGEATARRDELIRDCLVVMAAYVHAGRPDVRTTPLGTYDAWRRMVPDALVWAGCADPCAVMERTRAADPMRQELAAVLTAWHATYGAEGATAQDAIATTDDDLREALGMVALRGGRLDGRALSYWLRAHRDSRCGSLVLRNRPARAGRKKWYVETTISEAVDGEDSEDVSNARARDGRDVTNIYSSPEHPHHPHHPGDRERGGV